VEIAALSHPWARNVRFTLVSYNEALQFDADSFLDGWISLTKNAALCEHTHILEDRPILVKEPRPHAEE
jgi:hypothetical protein